MESRLQDDDLRADYLREAAFVVWDELPMANVAIVEAVDRLMQRLMQNDYPFGGKVFIGMGISVKSDQLSKMAGQLLASLHQSSHHPFGSCLRCMSSQLQ